MLIKVIVSLVVLVAIGAIGFTLLGEGVFQTIPEARAQSIIQEATEVEEAMEIYALQNDGVVDIGDPTLNQTTLHFVKQAELLKDWAGSDFDVALDPWLINEGDQTVERVVENEEICQIINHIRAGEPKDAEVFACNTPEGEAQFCCFTSA